MPDQILTAQISSLINAHLLAYESAEQLAFRHSLIRDAVYHGLLGRERKRYHREIAETLEQWALAQSDGESLKNILADLSLHYYEAGAWDKALEYSQRAGQQAQQMYAPREAIIYLTRALNAAAAAPTDPPPALWRARGQAYDTIGEFDLARADYEAALLQAPQTAQPQAEWQALLDLGFLWAARDYARSGEYFQAALNLARKMGDPETLGHTLNRVGNWYLNTEQLAQALTAHQEALGIFEALDDPRGLAETYDLLAISHIELSDLVQGASYYQQAVALFRALDDRQGLSSSLANLSACAASYWTDFVVAADVTLADGVAMAQEAARLAHEISWRAGEAYALGQLGSLYASSGEFGKSLELGERSRLIADEIQHHQWIGISKLGIGSLYLDVMALEEAETSLLEALAQMREVQSPLLASIAAGTLAATYIQQKKLVEAETLLAETLSAQGVDVTLLIASPDAAGWKGLSIGQRLCVLDCGALEFAKNKPASALQILDPLFISMPNRAMRPAIPRLDILRAEALVQLGDLDQAARLLKVACEALEVRHGLPTLWRAHVVLGKVYAQQGREDEARQEYAAAREIVETLAATVSEASLREKFLKRALALIPHTDAPPRPAD